MNNTCSICKLPCDLDICIDCMFKMKNDNESRLCKVCKRICYYNHTCIFCEIEIESQEISNVNLATTDKITEIDRQFHNNANLVTIDEKNLCKLCNTKENQLYNGICSGCIIKIAQNKVGDSNNISNINNINNINHTEDMICQMCLQCKPQCNISNLCYDCIFLIEQDMNYAGTEPKYHKTCIVCSKLFDEIDNDICLNCLTEMKPHEVKTCIKCNIGLIINNDMCLRCEFAEKLCKKCNNYGYDKSNNMCLKCEQLCSHCVKTVISKNTNLCSTCQISISHEYWQI